MTGPALLAPARLAASRAAGDLLALARRPLALVLGALLLFRVAYWLLAPPNPDEAYYWLWGRHPALSYYDHAPLAAWTGSLFTALLGSSAAALRLPTLLTLVGDLVLVRRLVGRIGGAAAPDRFAAAAAAFLASPLFAMFTSFAWPDHLLVFFSLLAAAHLLDFLAEVAAGGRGSSLSLVLGAAALGLAGLSKYNAVLLALGVALAIAGDARLRRLWRDPRLWGAALLALLLLSPVLAWNLAHGGASLRYNLLDRHLHGGRLEPSPRGAVNFALNSALFLSPFLLLGLAGALRRPPAATAFAQVYRRVALATFAASTAFFGLLSGFTLVLYYWNLPAWILLLPEAGALAERPRLLRAHLGYGFLLVAGMTAHAVLLPLSAPFPSIRDEDSKVTWGWGEVAAAVRQELGPGGPGPFVAATDYRTASELAFALGDPEVTALSDRPSQFDVWRDDARLNGRDAIVVADAWHPVLPGVAGLFAELEPPRTVRVERFGVPVKEYRLYRGRCYAGR